MTRAVDAASPPAAAPLITLGLPVFNGEAYLAGAIEALLAQSFGAFELVISDNGSTDRTCAIAGAAAARDPRIRYVRQEQNRGALWNFRHVLDLARTPYFMWRAHDDVASPAFLGQALDALMRDGDLACVQGLSSFTVDGHTIFRQRGGWSVARGDQQRFFLAREMFGKCMFMYGLFRTEVLRGADWSLLSQDNGWWWNDALFLQSIVGRGGLLRIDVPAISYRLKLGRERRGSVVAEDARSFAAKLLSYHPRAFFDRAVAIAPPPEQARLRRAVPLKILKSNIEAVGFSLYQRLALRWLALRREPPGGR